MESAVLFTGGILDQPFAKTAHALLRYSKRYHIYGVIDEKFSGDGVHVLKGGIVEFFEDCTDTWPITESILVLGSISAADRRIFPFHF